MGIELEKIDVGVDDKGDAFQVVIAIMIAVVSLTGAVIAWQASLAEPDDADRAGLKAALNAETTRFVNTAVLYKRYRAYTDYTLNDEYQRQIEEDLAGVADKGSLEDARDEAADLAAASRLFFPSRYLNRDGSYNTRRDLGEALAQAGQLNDLEPQPHFDEADNERLKVILIITVLIGLAISLLFYTLAEMLHPARTRLRYGSAAGGTLFLLVGIAAAVSIAVGL